MFSPALFLFLLLASPASAYHLHLETKPADVFPIFHPFGTIDIHVSDAGVRVDSVWLDGFSRTGSADVTIINPMVRMYTDMPIRDMASLIAKLGEIGEVEKAAVATLGSVSRGKVGNLPALRHRLTYGEAYIDYWTTNAIPENPQLRLLVHELLIAVSPGTAAVAKQIRGTPVYVELNFERFKKVPLVRMKSLTGGNEELSVGRFYIRAPIIDALWK